MSPAEKLKQENYSEEEIAEALGLEITTMRTYRSEGKDHPPFKKLGRKTYYPKKEFHAWVEKKALVRSVS